MCVCVLWDMGADIIPIGLVVKFAALGESFNITESAFLSANVPLQDIDMPLFV